MRLCYITRSEIIAPAAADATIGCGAPPVCEARLLRGMPSIPVYFDSWSYLERPGVRGLRLNSLDIPSAKYAWIDRNRRLQ